MPVRPRLSAAAVREYSPAVVAYLESGACPEGDEGGGLAIFLLGRQGLVEAWRVLGVGILRRWIRESPGSRPAGWWWFSAPRWQKADQPARVQRIAALDCAEPRRRLGGVGTPCFDVLSYWPEFDRGIPVDWVDQWSVDYYTGQARHVGGHLIGQEYVGSGFAGVAVDPHDPPVYEAQAEYLRRHGLLVRGELERLTPADFAPEAIPIDPDDEDA